MRASGVIAEYNPFHNGHRYHVEKAREISHAEVIIAVMSGNFLQRGEPAIIDKWSRANEALHNGVDLVVELPIQWSLQAADYFGKGGITLLNALGCESICFGTDSEDTIDYEQLGAFLNQHQKQIDAIFLSFEKDNLTYAQKMAMALKQLDASLAINADQPNHLLAMSYAKENMQLDHPMKLQAIKRKGASHLSKKIEAHFASATAIRQAVFQGKQVEDVVPNQTRLDLQNSIVSWEDYWPYLKYRIQSSSLEELREIYQMSEGLEYRLKEKVTASLSFSEFINQVKSKRYTQTRIQRLLCYILLNIKEKEMEAAWQTNAIRILGYTDKGKDYLNLSKKEFLLPTISKIGKQEVQQYPMMVKSDRIFQMGNKAIREQNFGRFPVHV
ncbi:MAG TPA: nucleotidyltransferase [Candidatus Tetragenococcus pullicola]|nr:nucleotidyltransferase [Candidatus Tetragenococcus pullicola]